MTVEGGLNVVQVTQFLEIGGLESFIVELSKKLYEVNVKTGVLCLNGYDESYKRSLAQNNISVELVKKKNKYDLTFFFRAASLIKKRKIDVLHAHGGCFLYSTIIGKIAGVKRIIYTAHGMPVTTGIKSRLEDFIACLLADKIVAVSTEIAEDLRLKLPFFFKKIEVIINGINTMKYAPCNDTYQLKDSKKKFGLPEDGKIIGTVGRLERVKNYSMLLRAFAKLVHIYGHKDCHLSFVGTGSEKPYLYDLAKELLIGDKVLFLGMQYNLPEIYPLFDVFALSSLTEGTSLSLLEAQSCGIPAVVTDVGENGTIIQDGLNGFLCRSGDSNDMAEKLDRLINNVSELTKMKQLSRDIIMKKYDIDSMIDKYLHVYGE